jgi:hypothetical protein
MGWVYGMDRLTSVLFLVLAALPALAQDVAVRTDTPAAEASSDKPETAVKADAVAPGDKEFKPPPGFRTKKRGEHVLYCMKDSTVGTRFKTEKCYDEDQMREYLLALEIQKRDIDRIRSTCATASVCAPQ